MKDNSIERIKEIQAEIDVRSSNLVTVSELEEAKEMLKHLEKTDGVEVPALIKNIDNLEQFVLKALKNQLNEDNKKS